MNSSEWNSTSKKLPLGTSFRFLLTRNKNLCTSDNEIAWRSTGFPPIKSFMILCLDKSLYTFQICWQNYRAFRFNKQSNENTERKNIASFSTNFLLRVKLYQTRANWCNFFSFMLVSKISGICFTTCEDKNIESRSKISQPLCHNHNQECIEGRFILSCHSFTKG